MLPTTRNPNQPTTRSLREQAHDQPKHHRPIGLQGHAVAQPIIQGQPVPQLPKLLIRECSPTTSVFHPQSVRHSLEEAKSREPTLNYVGSRPVGAWLPSPPCRPVGIGHCGVGVGYGAWPNTCVLLLACTRTWARVRERALPILRDWAERGRVALVEAQPGARGADSFRVAPPNHPHVTLSQVPNSGGTNAPGCLSQALSVALRAPETGHYWQNRGETGEQARNRMSAAGNPRAHTTATGLLHGRETTDEPR